MVSVPSPAMSAPSRITRLAVRNYRSIVACDVALGALSILVGRNGAGKSNVLDALRFIGDSVRASLEYALRVRGGLHHVKRRPGPPDASVGIRIEVALGHGCHAVFAVEFSRAIHGGIVVQREACRIIRDADGSSVAHYHVAAGSVITASVDPAPAASADRLYVVNASGHPAFRPLYDALAGMAFYNTVPGAMRVPSPPDDGELLDADGHNVASVLRRLLHEDESSLVRIEEYLTQVVPGLAGVHGWLQHGRDSLVFRQRIVAEAHPWGFDALDMSDGTLRALGVLAALFQDPSGRSVRLVGIEEPDAALHPGAMAVLADALLEASERRQVLVTTHSAALLDHAEIAPSFLLAVVDDGASTRVGPVDDVTRQVLRDGLFSAGELLRMGQLELDGAHGDATTTTVADLFQSLVPA